MRRHDLTKKDLPTYLPTYLPTSLHLRTPFKSLFVNDIFISHVYGQRCSFTHSTIKTFHQSDGETLPQFSLGPSYRWAESISWNLVCVSVITPTFPLKTLLNHFRCFTDPQNHCLVDFWWFLEHVCWCLVVSDACLVVSSGVNVYWLIWPELIDVYGQISLPADAAKMLMLLKCWCC